MIRLETRKENIEQKGSICIRELLKNSLRMRPDRIIIGECRGGEALDMLQAMNTGHEGSMTTIHSNSTVDALRRLETLVLFASSHLPSRAIREQISSAIHYIIQLSRNEKGHRYISAIHQMVSLSENNNFITKYELIKIVSEIYNLNIDIIPFETLNKCDRTLKGDIIIEKDLYEQIVEMRDFNL